MGIVAYGAHVPYWRLARPAVGAALGSGGGRGTRAVASYDENTTTMGVEAARVALRSAPRGAVPAAVVFATADPAYLDKTNATAVHAALDLPASVPAWDMAGSVRSGAGALVLGRGLVVLSDVRTGLPGGSDERDGGDGAAAFLFGDDADSVAVVLGTGAATGEFLDRWRVPGEPSSRQWEERFGEHAYVPLAEAAVTDALKAAGLSPAAVDRAVVTGPNGRAVRKVAVSLAAAGATVTDDLAATVGFTGAAHAGLLLAATLDEAGPDEVVAVVVLADGADVVLLRTTEALAGRRPSPTVAEQVASGRDDLPYATYLTWRGLLRREPPRRPDPDRPAAPPSLRTEGWKFGFTAARCTACGTRHLPPQRVCQSCGATDEMAPERLADVPATVATFTVDRLGHSPSPPIVAAVVDFDGGGRFQCELTDVDPAAIAIGDRVTMTFRRLFVADGVQNYFWKARPLRS